MPKYPFTIEFGTKFDEKTETIILNDLEVIEKSNSLIKVKDRKIITLLGKRALYPSI